MLTNLLKSATALVATPVALVADILTLPANNDPFRRTGEMLDAVGYNFKKAVDPKDEPKYAD